MGVERTKVFISYSHRDAQWMERLKVHLTPLEREGMLDFWIDTDIEPGQQWYDEIEEAIAQAKVAVLLISPDFLASEFIATEEVPRVLAAADKEGLKVIPIFLKPSNINSIKRISRFQGVNDPQHTLSSLPTEAEQDEMLVKASNAIVKALDAPIRVWHKRTFRRSAGVAMALAAGLLGLWINWPAIQARSTHAVMLVPDFQLRQVLPLVDGNVIQPSQLKISYGSHEMSVDTMRQRIYVLGASRNVLQRVMDSMSEEDRFAAIRAFLREANIEGADFDKAFGILTDGVPAFIESPRLKKDDVIHLQILRDKEGNSETLLDRSVTIEEGAFTTLILNKENH